MGKKILKSREKGGGASSRGYPGLSRIFPFSRNSGKIPAGGRGPNPKIWEGSGKSRGFQRDFPEGPGVGNFLGCGKGNFRDRGREFGDAGGNFGNLGMRGGNFGNFGKRGQRRSPAGSCGRGENPGILKTWECPAVIPGVPGVIPGVIPAVIAGIPGGIPGTHRFPGAAFPAPGRTEPPPASSRRLRGRGSVGKTGKGPGENRDGRGEKPGKNREASGMGMGWERRKTGKRPGKHRERIRRESGRDRDWSEGETGEKPGWERRKIGKRPGKDRD